LLKLESFGSTSENCSILKIHRQLAMSLTIFIIILILFFGLTSFQTQHQSAYASSNSIYSISQTEILYQCTIKNFANTYTIAEGKLFVISKYDLNCFDARTGKNLWQITVGGGSYAGAPLVVQDGIVFAGVAEGKVITVDANTGKLLPLQFQAIVETSWGSKSTPTAFAVADGRLYVAQTGWRAYNVSTGVLLWETFSPSRTNPPNMPYNDNVWAFDDNLVLAAGIYPSGNNFYNGVYRINSDTGTILWSIPWFSNNQPLVYNGSIIFWNCNETNSDTGQTVLSVDATTGNIFWNLDLKTVIYKPVIYQEQLLFVTSDGHLCMLNLSEGSLVWEVPLKTPYVSSDVSSGISSIQVDSQSQRIFWSYTTMEYIQSTDNFQYEGFLYSLDLTEGNVIWASPFKFNSGFFSYPSVQTEIAVLNNTVFLNTGVDLLTFNKSTGTLFGSTNFEHCLLPIVSAYNKLFVVADLTAIAYTNYSDSAITEPHSLPKTCQQIIVLAVVGIIITLLTLVYRKHRNKHNTPGTVPLIPSFT